jgi:hypothetical protein
MSTAVSPFGETVASVLKPMVSGAVLFMKRAVVAREDVGDEDLFRPTGCVVVVSIDYDVVLVTSAMAFDMVTSSASFLATVAIGSSPVLRPLREASIGLTSRRASYVVP